MPIPSLPLEIIGAILKHTSNRGDQARCCLVSKSFLPFARRKLYRGVSINYRSVPGRSLLRLLASEPHLATLVLVFTFSWRSPRYDPTSASTSDDFQEELAVALSACCSLVNLMLYVSRRQDAPSVPMAFNLRHALEDVGQRLKALVIDGAYWSTGLDDVLAAQLALGQLSIDLSGSAHLGRPPFQLQTFSARLSDGEPLSWRAVSDILAASRHSLNELSLDTRDAPLTAELDLASFDALRRLDVHCDFDDEENMERVIFLLSTSPTLQYIRLGSNYGTTDDHPFDRFDFLRRIPLPLTKVQLQFLSISTTYLLAVLADDRYLRGLKTLELDEPALPLEGVARVRSLQEEAAVAAAGERRGIKVVWNPTWTELKQAGIVV